MRVSMVRRAEEPAKSKFTFAEDELAKIRRARLDRSMIYGSVAGPHIKVKGRTLLNLCSNDYLALQPTALRPSQMQSSSRLLSGNDESYRLLEEKLAQLKSSQSALVYPTGYMANLGAIGALAGAGDLILSDRLNHISIIQAARLSGALVSVYEHNDVDSLQSCLRAKARRKFIVTEGIFSMDGDLARLKEIAEVAEKASAVLVLDDAHGDFVMGASGRGTAYHLGTAADVYTSSLSKALGSFGGYVSSHESVVELCINKSKPFIYTSALPVSLVHHAEARLAIDMKPHRSKLAGNVRLISKGFYSLGLASGPQTHIIPIMVGDEGTAVAVARFLYERGVFAQAVRYPTVPMGTARIRISVTAWLEREHIDAVLEALEAATAKFALAT